MGVGFGDVSRPLLMCLPDISDAEESSIPDISDAGVSSISDISDAEASSISDMSDAEISSVSQWKDNPWHILRAVVATIHYRSVYHLNRFEFVFCDS